MDGVFNAAMDSTSRTVRIKIAVGHLSDSKCPAGFYFGFNLNLASGLFRFNQFNQLVSFSAAGLTFGSDTASVLT